MGFSSQVEEGSAFWVEFNGQKASK